jgi:hypothetical protein
MSSYLKSTGPFLSPSPTTVNKDIINLTMYFQFYSIDAHEIPTFQTARNTLISPNEIKSFISPCGVTSPTKFM